MVNTGKLSKRIMTDYNKIKVSECIVTAMIS